ncbi:hypothetical protein [Desulfoscipio gibsoniae]|uniref:Uncharacterized protein n=1 Tax=Desulfoscipio gibsoniae DSM 7213 TaxID=767817 RepID=R4KGV2_9FIRM|nr:hypothetical protein [Desulfoscipio gibsoniae]AGK99754.1 hypothetical protein Desgi_0141 [Desulfoscipio gibsoniae DSM 7213]
MKIYHICECCDRVFKVTESAGRAACVDNLTGDNTGDIMMREPENGSGVASGLCEECREEIYGSEDHFFYSPRLN